MEDKIAKVAGVDRCEISFAGKTARIRRDKKVIDDNRLIDSIAGFGYKSEVKTDIDNTVKKTSLKNILLLAAIIAVVLQIPTALLKLPEAVKISLAVISIVCSGGSIFRLAWYSLKSLSADMNLLMTIAVAGAMFIGEWVEGSLTIVLYALAEYLEDRSVRRAHGAFKTLSENIPQTVEIEEGNSTRTIPLSELKSDAVIRLKPGMTVPTDCEIIEGRAYINQAAVTGEAQPVSMSVGDTVLGGVINTDGALRLRVLKPYRDSTLSKILTMVEQAGARKSHLANIVDRFARVYTPIMVGLAFLVTVIPTVFFGQEFQTWFYRALVFLVISCPCAFVISTPIAVICGLTNAARKGVLVKGGVFLERLADLRAILFDKTGTLTAGVFEVADIRTSDGFDEIRLLTLAASLEQYSEHPIARAILAEADKRQLATVKAQDFTAYPGEGAGALIDSKKYFIGSPDYFRSKKYAGNIDSLLGESSENGNSTVLLAEDNSLIGSIALRDNPRIEASSAIQDLHRVGIKELVMLTGDNQSTAQSLAGQIGLDKFESQLLPDQKAEIVEKYRKRYKTVGMVGDGINDAPALASADVGIAMGTGGSDMAIEAADVAILGDNLAQIPRVIALSKRTLGIIKFNIAFALIAKFAVMGLATVGIATLWMAIFADTGLSLLVIANSLRLLKDKQ